MTVQKIPIFKIQKLSIGDNSYAVSRAEQWVLKQYSEFETMLEAKKFIREQHRVSNDFIILSHTLGYEEKEKFLDEFSFENDLYLLYRTYFLGTKKEISTALNKALKDNGALVRNE